MTTSVTLPHIEHAVASKIYNRIVDHLGVAEDKTPGVGRGATPPPIAYERIESWPVENVERTPTVFITGGVDPESKARRSNGFVWSTVVVEVYVVVGASGTDHYSIGEAGRVYAFALESLFEQERDLGDLVINDVSPASVLDFPKRDNGDALSHVAVSVTVDAPVVDLRPYFADPQPNPSGPANLPDVPVQVADLIINVEARP